jgi:hypothetical protein
MPWLDIFQLDFSDAPFYCFSLVFIDIFHSLKSDPFYSVFCYMISASSSLEVVVLIDPVLASSGDMALSPNNSLNGVKPIDLDTVVL